MFCFYVIIQKKKKNDYIHRVHSASYAYVPIVNCQGAIGTFYYINFGLKRIFYFSYHTLFYYSKDPRKSRNQELKFFQQVYSSRYLGL